MISCYDQLLIAKFSLMNRPNQLMSRLIKIKALLVVQDAVKKIKLESSPN